MDAIHYDGVFELRLGKDGENLLQLVVGREEDGAASGIAQRKGGLLSGERRVERDGDGSEEQGGHVRNGPLGAVFAEDGDAVAFTNSPVAQRAGDGRDFLAELPGRNGQPLALVAVEHHAVEVALDSLEKDVV